MAKKQNITESQAKEWADAAMEAAQPLRELIIAIDKQQGIDEFTEKEVYSITGTLAAVAKTVSEAAGRVIMQGSISMQRREIAKLQDAAREGGGA